MSLLDVVDTIREKDPKELKTALHTGGTLVLLVLGCMNVQACFDTRELMKKGHNLSEIERMARETPVRVRTMEEYREDVEERFGKAWEEKGFSDLDEYIEYRYEQYRENMETFIGPVREDARGRPFAYAENSSSFWTVPGRHIAYRLEE